jgi:hypothetical protein
LSSLLRDRPASTPAMLAVFGDAALLRAALLFEAVLAEAQVAEGLIPLEAGEAIVAACVELPDVEDLAEAAAHAGNPGHPSGPDPAPARRRPARRRRRRLGPQGAPPARTWPTPP